MRSRPAERASAIGLARPREAKVHSSSLSFTVHTQNTMLLHKTLHDTIVVVESMLPYTGHVYLSGSR